MPSLPGLERLAAEIAALRSVYDVGRVTEVQRGVVIVRGLSHAASLGDQVCIHGRNGGTLHGEVTGLDAGRIFVLPDTLPEGIVIGDRVILMGPVTIAPDASWIGRIVDPSGLPLDGKPLLRGSHARALCAHPPAAAQRRPMEGRLETGMQVFNTLLPLVRGQRVGLFAGSGVGKSSLLAKFARAVEADVVVIAMIGERGRELREFADKVLGAAGLARSVVVAATSDQSPVIRRRCGWTAMAVAEYFRDQGKHVLLLADSITRFAEAHREIALASGETASLRGYPPSTAHMITQLCERAGPGTGGTGDITAVFSVLVAGSDMNEPVADILRGVLDGHVVMDRHIAERGRFPAVDLLRSVSRSLPDAATSSENELIARARRYLGAYERAEMMIQAGLYVAGSDPVIDAAIRVWPELDAFLAEDAPGGMTASFARLAECLSLAEDVETEEDVAGGQSAKTR